MQRGRRDDAGTVPVGPRRQCAPVASRRRCPQYREGVHRQPALVLVPLAILFVVMGLVEAWRDAPTVAESVEIVAGVTSLVRHDLRLMPERGVLTKVLPALPALIARPGVPDGSAYQSGVWFDDINVFI